MPDAPALDSPPAASSKIPPPAPFRDPECPRCGYDQSGAVATWLNECPLEGVCPECGLSFRWGAIFATTIVDSQTKFEFAQRSLARAAVRTWRTALSPWRFWSWMQITDPIRPRRLFGFAVLGVLMSYLVASIGAAVIWFFGPFLAVAVSGWRAGGGDYSDHPVYAAAMDVWLWGAPIDWNYGDAPNGWRAIVFVWILLLPLTYRIIGETLSRVNIRPGHLWRLWIYTFVALPFVIGVPFALFSALHIVAWWNQYIAVGPPDYGIYYYSSPGGFYEVVEALVQNRWVFITPWIGLWLTVCQGFALKRYLKIPRPWIVACTLTFISGLAAFTFAIIPEGGNWLVGAWFIWDF